MMLWIIFACMSAAAIFAVLWPLGRKPRLPETGNDIAVYRDQLDEIDRDRKAGLIAPPEAEAARIEVSRRLLAAADGPSSRAVAAPRWHRPAAVAAALLVLSLLPVGIYLTLGSPGLPDQSAFARRVDSPQPQSMASLVAQVEEHLAHNPNDGAGWEVLAPVYMRLGRFDDAVAAWRKAVALNGETAGRDANLGEALVAAADGIVTDEAKQSFMRAVGRDAHEPKAQYFLGLADEQDGDKAGAAAKWRALLEQGPADAPWVGFVREALARLTGQPVGDKGPSAAQMAAAQDLPEAQRNEMIRGMVEKLSVRLHAGGGDVDGWLRLVRAYAVLGETAKAKGAADDARRALADRPDDLKRLDELVRGLGLEG